jgi:hypothetical protein
MEKLKLICQKFTIEKGGKSFSYYLGAGEAVDLQKVAEAPSFQDRTPHREIVDEILKPPSTHWQRPLIENKVDEISLRFEDEQEIMPNPILLAVNPDSKIFVQQYITPNGATSLLYEIEINIPDAPQNGKPLWIIDGQHRLAGLAKTKRGTNILPFVLLHSDTGTYHSSLLAKIFAQVTTQATALESVHKAWMQFVFELDPFKKDSADWRSMRTAALLCQTQAYNGNSNPFHNRIGFNPNLWAVEPAQGGFAFDAEELYKLLKKSFFAAAGSDSSSITEEKVAESIASAVDALAKVHTTNKNSSAFFGDGQSQQKYFKEGFIAGVCAYLIANGVPRDWETVLKDLKFAETDWDVESWVVTTSGAAGNASKKIAFDCFREVFSNKEIPKGASNLVQYLKGDGGYIVLETWEVDATETRISKSHQQFEIPLQGSSQISQSIPKNSRLIKISSPCKNIGSVEIRNKKAPYDASYFLDKFKKGRLIRDSELEKKTDSLNLELKFDLYGGLSYLKTLTLKFQQ